MSSMANTCGVLGIVMMCGFWLAMRFVPPPKSVYVVFLVPALVIVAASALTVFAALRASRWWWLAMILPLSGVAAVLSASG
jgi:drug/metabolite transporter (DMT)-like permease